jgi:hypothetical protein
MSFGDPCPGDRQFLDGSSPRNVRPLGLRPFFWSHSKQESDPANERYPREDWGNRIHRVLVADLLKHKAYR